MNPDRVRQDLQATALMIEAALGDLGDWTRPGRRPSQYECDVVADAAAVKHLLAAGYGVISEERPPERLHREVVVVVDPIDGTENAIRGGPSFGPSLCAFVAGRPVVAHLRNLATGDCFDAIAGDGASHNGTVARCSERRAVPRATIVVSGSPVPGELSRTSFIGAVAFALCAVAVGEVDGFLDLDDDHHRCWDYSGGALVCREAGAVVADGLERDLWTLDPSCGRAPIAAATPELLAGLLRLRRGAKQEA
jgi:myo-inositol-1(or 4)-monophosphatase